MKFWDIVACVTAVLLLTATATPQTAQTTPSRDKNSDSYAVYSKLLLALFTLKPVNTQDLLRPTCPFMEYRNL